MEFKKGDKLRVLETSSEFKVGDIVEYVGECENSPEMIQVKTSTNNSSGGWYKTRFVLAKNAKLSSPTWIVVWEEDSDPAKFFTSEKDALAFIKKLAENSDVKQESIILAEVKNVRKVAISKRLSYSQYKTY